MEVKTLDLRCSSCHANNDQITNVHGGNVPTPGCSQQQLATGSI
jgi:hypothetical protein